MKKPGGKLPLPPVFARRSATPALRRAFFHAPHFRHGPGRKSGFNISKNLRAQRFPGNITRTQLFRYTVLPKGMLGGKRTASPAPARSGNIIPWRKTSYAKRRKPRAARKNGREERQGRRNAGRKARERTARGQERGNGRRREQEEVMGGEEGMPKGKKQKTREKTVQNTRMATHFPCIMPQKGLTHTCFCWNNKQPWDTVQAITILPPPSAAERNRHEPLHKTF